MNKEHLEWRTLVTLVEESDKKTFKAMFKKPSLILGYLVYLAINSKEDSKLAKELKEFGYKQ